MTEYLDINLRELHKQIKELLKNDYKMFLVEMKKMFALKNFKIAKDFFDSEIINLFSAENIHIFNEFIVTFWTKCEAGLSDEESTEIGIQGDVSKEVLDQVQKVHAEQPSYNPVDYIQYSSQIKKRKSSVETESFSCGVNGTLPNVAAIRARILLEAWENNLDYVDESVLHLLVSCSKTYMENILSSTLTRRHAFRTREDRFQHAFGSSPSNIYLKNNSKRFSHFLNRKSAPYRRTAHFSEINVPKEIACDNAMTKGQPPLSAIDLLDTFKVHRNLLASNGVYSTNVERIIASLHHPMNDEEEQEKINFQENELKASIGGEITLP